MKDDVQTETLFFEDTAFSFFEELSTCSTEDAVAWVVEYEKEVEQIISDLESDGFVFESSLQSVDICSWLIEVSRMALCTLRMHRSKDESFSWTECCISTGELLEARRRKPRGRPVKIDHSRILSLFKKHGNKAQVARLMDCSLGTVKNVIAKAKNSY